MMLFCQISNSNKENLKDSFNIIFTGMIFMLAILTLARVIMLFQFALSPFSEISFKEQLGFFILSLRFDLKIITITYSLPLLLTICLFSFNSLLCLIVISIFFNFSCNIINIFLACFCKLIHNKPYITNT